MAFGVPNTRTLSLPILLISDRFPFLAMQKYKFALVPCLPLPSLLSIQTCSPLPSSIKGMERACSQAAPSPRVRERNDRGLRVAWRRAELAPRHVGCAWNGARRPPDLSARVAEAAGFVTHGRVVLARAWMWRLVHDAKIKREQRGGCTRHKPKSSRGQSRSGLLRASHVGRARRVTLGG